MKEKVEKSQWKVERWLQEQEKRQEEEERKEKKEKKECGVRELVRREKGSGGLRGREYSVIAT